MRITEFRTTRYRAIAGGKSYASKRALYYAIAKKMILEKYPPLFRSENGYDEEYDDEDKRLVLFWDWQCGYEEPGGWVFNQDKWTRFVKRLARFLEFVDSRSLKGDGDAS